MKLLICRYIWVCNSKACVNRSEAVHHYEGVLLHGEAQDKDDISFWFATTKVKASHGEEQKDVKD